MHVRAHAYISGRVQGVFFRSSAEEKAFELGIKGWVRNLRDGRVEAIFEGEKEKVEEMLRWCYKGPPYARVTNVEVKWEDYKGEFRSFGVAYL
ncbi:MAG: acylphosphatase [Methanobacteriota archaeon]